MTTVLSVTATHGSPSDELAGRARTATRTGSRAAAASAGRSSILKMPFAKASRKRGHVQTCQERQGASSLPCSFRIINHSFLDTKPPRHTYRELKEGPSSLSPKEKLSHAHTRIARYRVDSSRLLHAKLLRYLRRLLARANLEQQLPQVARARFRLLVLGAVQLRAPLQLLAE